MPYYTCIWFSAIYCNSSIETFILIGKVLSNWEWTCFIGKALSNWECLLLYHWGLIKFWYKNTQSN